MSMASLEREIIYHARILLANQKLRLKDLLEWRTGEFEPQDGEIVVRIADGLSVWIAVKKECDKRVPK